MQSGSAAMKRDITKSLIEWKGTEPRLPILLRGARQVGKSYIVEDFGKQHFENHVTLNLELSPEYKPCFDNLDPQKILTAIELLTNTTITPGDTLLFIDEIQECPNAIMALRYFKEKMPKLHVIAAGSLLDFTLNQENFRMPVGRVQFYYLKPFSFKEFLVAADHHKLREFIENFSWEDDIPDIIHQKLIALVQLYCIIGGMPAAISAYLKNKSLKNAQDMQQVILSTYQTDFGKYAKHTPIEQLQLIFNKTPQLVTKQLKYSEISRDIQSRELKRSLQKLIEANLLYQTFATKATNLPLNALINPKKFKLLFLDTGLIQRRSNIDAEILAQGNLLSNHHGCIAEHFVGQELLANQAVLQPPEIYYWERDVRGSSAEVDYVTDVGDQIIPVEVKAGASGKLKSLKLFMQSHDTSLGVHIATHSFGIKNNIVTLPLYLSSELKRLLRVKLN